ncbi:hypothetical protein SY89_00534 [Halolamina pelagica]|uniref:DUF7130 domain-containing protein n=1 Tax=Halolamina pelagica TaxID=699431 RepID=A0A0P7GML5_9EURY|nr:hypothetical protein [Halolamina pelagica]KPN29816.1 hypothetical protein SY89_00534 [Halolamina pelagica]
MSEKRTVTIGAEVYDRDGTKLGSIRGLTDDGFAITTREGIRALSIDHDGAGHEFGEAELLSRCADCGELRNIEELPGECPDCGADRTALYYWTEG